VVHRHPERLGGDAYTSGVIDSQPAASTLSRISDAYSRTLLWVGSPSGATIVVAVITLFGLALRLWHLDTEPLHVDEIRQVTEVQDTWIRVIRASYGAQQPPLDYLIGKAVVTVLPATDFFQRLPAALLGSATVGLIGWILIGERLFIAAVFASGFVAISPLHVELSQYARPYALPVFMVVATLAAYQRWHGNRSWKWGVWFALLATLALLSRAVMPLIALGVLGAVALFRRVDAQTLRRPLSLLRADPLAFGVLPVLVVMVWIPGALRITSGTGNLSDCFACGKWGKAAAAVFNFGTFGERAVRPTSLAWLLVISIGILLSPYARRALSNTAWLWAPLLMTAPLFAIVHAIVLPPGDLFAHRFLVFLPVGFAVYLSIGLTAALKNRSEKSRVRFLILTAVGVLVVVAAVDMVSAVRVQAQSLDLADWRSTAEHVESIETLGDIIIAIDARPFSRESKFGFVAAPRYYDGTSEYATPQNVTDSPDRAIGANRYHFMIFVPKMASDWRVPSDWLQAEFSEMLILSTPQLHDDADRAEAWWTVSSQLRPDVAIATQIAGIAFAHHVGIDAQEWIDVALDQAAQIGQSDFAKELIDEALGG
jgi:hypothetical protein